MYLIIVKDNGTHTVIGIAETIEEVKKILNESELNDKIDNGKAYLVKGDITLIRPETTPELLNIKEVRKKKNKYY
jgi:hypothetical protein